MVPVKAFHDAKGRLAGALADQTRARLAERMATHLVRAQQELPVVICCDDEGVAAWATSCGAATIWCPGTDLNGAVRQGFNELREAGYATVVIAHSDLPLAGDLGWLARWPGVTLVPDRHRSGTNVMSLPTSLDFRFQYGTDSLRLHVGEATRHRRGLRIVHDDNLGWDIDNPSDLELPAASTFLADLLESDPHS